MIPHLLRCQGFAVDDYGFALGRLGSGASSAFAQSGLKAVMVQMLLAFFYFLAYKLKDLGAREPFGIK